VSIRHKQKFVFRHGFVTKRALRGWHARCVDFQTRRLDPRLAALVVAHDVDGQPMAETWRRVGETAEELGLSRPSYHTVRELVRHERRRRKARTEVRQAALGILGAAASPRAVNLPIALDALARARAKERLVSDRHKPP
jgi:hypothetical protein